MHSLLKYKGAIYIYIYNCNFFWHLYLFWRKDIYNSTFN